TTMFKASSPYWADIVEDKKQHRITDGPFMYRTKTDELLMIWSTFIKGKYAECLVRFNDGELSMNFEHLDPLLDDDGGHGMIFRSGDKLYLTFHSPNQTNYERPHFTEIVDNGNSITIK
ncbi:MAG: glycoside hydrolase, partial [Clostridia bacterium]|nr:glycoside hydrolase [Clostridia bacterium]